MLITNAKLITWEEPNRILEDHALRIEAGCLAEIAPQAELLARYPTARRLDAGGQYVMPGNICAHTHFYGAFARGMAIPGPAPEDFLQILKKLWWPLDKALTLEDVRASTLVMLVDAIKHGTTTLFDHHASPNCIEGSLDVIANAVKQAGLRAVLCYEVTDRDGPDKARAGIAENVRFYRELVSRNRGDSQFPIADSRTRVASTFGLHAPLTLSEETLAACRAAAPEAMGFHFHLSESTDDGHSVAQRGHGWPVDWLNRGGILGPKSIAAHGVHLDELEMQQLAESGTWVTHQPRSNMNNAVGVAAVEDMLHRGVRLGLGTDGFSSTMWEEWKAAYWLHKVHHGDPRRMSALDVVRMGVYNNAALANQFLPAVPLGILTQGAAADLIFVDYHPFTPLTPENLPWHMIFGFHESMITTTIVAGEVLMRDRQLLTLDEEAIAAHALELAPKVWERYRRNVP